MIKLVRHAVLAALALTVATAATAAEPKALAHLASYKGRDTAERGWHILADQYSSVLYFRPEMRIVDLDGKGRFFRLYAEGDQDLMRMLCASLVQRRLYCVLHDAQSLQPIK